MPPRLPRTIKSLLLVSSLLNLITKFYTQLFLTALHVIYSNSNTSTVDAMDTTSNSNPANANTVPVTADTLDANCWLADYEKVRESLVSPVSNCSLA